MKTYKEIQEEYSSNKIPYHVLLNTQEWSERRAEIIIRDSCTCQMCNQNKAFKYPNLILETRYRENGSSYSVEMSPRNIMELAEDYRLQVHHKYYIEGYLPWEYEDNLLITYCFDCHKKWHEENNIEYFALIEGILKNKQYTVCGRCNGVGWFPEYSYCDGGVCYECYGKKFKELI